VLFAGKLRPFYGNTRQNINAKNYCHINERIKRERAKLYWQNHVIQNCLPINESESPPIINIDKKKLKLRITKHKVSRNFDPINYDSVEFVAGLR